MRVILAELMGLRRLGRPSPRHQRRGDRGWRAQDPGGGGWVVPRNQCHPLSCMSQRRRGLQRWCGLQRWRGVSIKARAAWPRPAGLLGSGWRPGAGPFRRGGWLPGRPDGCACRLRSAPCHWWRWWDRAAAGVWPAGRSSGVTNPLGRQTSRAPFDHRSRWRAGGHRG